LEEKVIQEGKEFESFNDFWRASGFTNYKNKDSQRKELQRYYDWVEVKNGKYNKIKITEVYTVPKEKENNTGKSEGSRRNNIIYQDDMAIVIEHFLSLSKKHKVDITISNLALSSNIVSEDYKKCKNDEDDYFDKLKNINRTALENTMYKLYPVIRDGVYGALNLLQNQGKIMYEYVIFIEEFGELNFITEEMEKELNKIEKKIIEELIDEHSNKYKQLTKKDIMKSSKLRNQYYNRVFNEFIKNYNDVTNLFYGVHIIIKNCKAQKDIIEVNNRLIETIKSNILEKNKNQVIKVKEEYKRKDNEKEENVALGALPMAEYEINIIINEKSYIEDTIRLMELFCGQVKQDVNEKLENTEHGKLVELNNHVNKDNIKETSISVPKGKDNRHELIDIASIGSEPPIHKNENNNKERTLDGLLSSISFLAKARSRKNNNYQEEKRSDDECISLDYMRSEILKERHEIQKKIDWIEMGVREGNLNDLYKQLKDLDERYFEVNKWIIDSCKNDTPMAL
jgi:hypothetical protein